MRATIRLFDRSSSRRPGRDRGGMADADHAERVLRRYIDAVNSHDFSNVRAVLHPEASFWFTDATCRTERDIQSYFENAWRIVEGEVYAAADVAWLAVGPDGAACTYTYRYTGRHNGAPVSGRGRATNVFVKHGGRWLLVHEHLSAEPGN